MIEQKNELIKQAMNIVLEPVDELYEDDFNNGNKIPFTEIASLGAIFSSIPEVFRTVQTTTVGGAGIYKASIPAGQMLTNVKGNPDLFRGFTRGAEGITGHATFEPCGLTSQTTTVVPIDPATMCMAVALMSIDKKLDAVKETSEEILSFVTQQARSRVTGNINVLMETMEGYKFNWDNEMYRSNKHQQALEIKRDAEQNIDLQKNKIKRTSHKSQFINTGKDVQDKIRLLKREFRDYHSALYSFAFASYIEVMLLENFSEEYINSVVDKIKMYADDCRQMFSDCYEIIENETGKSLESVVLEGLSFAGKATGKAISKLPRVNTKPVENVLVEAGEKIDDFRESAIDETMLKFISGKTDYTEAFVNGLNIMNKIYNHGFEMLIGKDSVVCIDVA